MRALVTGSGVRIGAAIGRALATSGFEVVLHCNRSRAAAEDLATELVDSGHAAAVISADLSTPAGCRDLAAQAGPIDVLVNNAGVFAAAPFATLTLQQWDTMQAINCRAPFLLSQALLPSLQRSTLAGGGAIINIGDISGTRPVAGYAHYVVSKAGLLMLTKAMALELAPHVRVNSISPGTVLPPADYAERDRQAIAAAVPAGRLGSATDIAQAVSFLIQAPYITGHDIVVDGGLSVVGNMGVA